jgi:hypothetical protein
MVSDHWCVEKGPAAQHCQNKRFSIVVKIPQNQKRFPLQVVVFAAAVPPSATAVFHFVRGVLSELKRWLARLIAIAIPTLFCDDNSWPVA